MPGERGQGMLVEAASGTIISCPLALGRWVGADTHLMGTTSCETAGAPWGAGSPREEIGR